MPKMPEQSAEPVGGENPHNTAPSPAHPHPSESLPSGIPPGADPGPVPGESKKARQLMLALPEESVTLLRRISGLTKISQAHLIEEIENSKELRAAALDVLRETWLGWKKSHEKNDPFADLKSKE